MGSVRRLLVVAGVFAAATFLSATPASAHTGAGPAATDYRTTLGSLSPPVAGLEVRVVDAGNRLELRDDTARQVVVLGYQGEPWYRIDSSGFFINANSPNTGPPLWKRIGGCCLARWHDHRIHAPSVLTHALAQLHPRRTDITQGWVVPMLVAGQPVQVSGTLQWVPAPNPWPWVALAVLLLAAVAAGATTVRWGAVLAAAIAAMAVAQGVHLVGFGLAFAGSAAHQGWLVVSSSYYSLIACTVGLVAIRLLLRRNPDGLFLATFSGAVIGVFSAIGDGGVLWHSQATFAPPAGLDRLVVAVSIGLGLGVAAGAMLAIRRHAKAPEAPEQDPEQDPVPA
jgi:hypothetical protein